MATINNIKYSKIDSSTARVGDGSSNEPNAITSDYSGEVFILPRVSIDGKSYDVTEVGKDAFDYAYSVTNVHIPNTIKTLRVNSFGWMKAKTFVIPESVTAVESYFIAEMAPDNITFLGIKEPKMSNGDGDFYISSKFKGKVIVPLEYEPKKTTFLYKSILRMNILKKRETYHIRRRRLYFSSHIVLVILLSVN